MKVTKKGKAPTGREKQLRRGIKVCNDAMQVLRSIKPFDRDEYQYWHNLRELYYKDLHKRNK